MKPFIPPKDREEDFNEEIDRMIEAEIERRFDEEEIFHQGLWHMEDDPDDLANINIG